jgi:hypothetical protein
VKKRKLLLTRLQSEARARCIRLSGCGAAASGRWATHQRHHCVRLQKPDAKSVELGRLLCFKWHLILAALALSGVLRITSKHQHSAQLQLHLRLVLLLVVVSVRNHLHLLARHK